MAKINVQNTEITIVSHNDDDYISLTDMARSLLRLWLLAIVILLTAAMLFVTYRISRKKESNYVRTN